MSGTKLIRRALGCGLLALGLTSSAHAQCQLNSPSGKIKHVVYIEFDNVHFTRDNPNVPSDLEQMPNLLNFIKQNGTLDTGDHAVLISHTANDILTTQTGLYPDDRGIFVSNNFGVYAPPSGSPRFRPPCSPRRSSTGQTWCRISLWPPRTTPLRSLRL